MAAFRSVPARVTCFCLPSGFGFCIVGYLSDVCLEVVTPGSPMKLIQIGQRQHEIITCDH